MIHGDGGDLTMAQVCGEQEYGPLTFIPGVDFDPSDPDECEHVRMASESDAHARIRQLEEENARLRAQLGEGAPTERRAWCPECETEVTRGEGGLWNCPTHGGFAWRFTIDANGDWQGS